MMDHIKNDGKKQKDDNDNQDNKKSFIFIQH